MHAALELEGVLSIHVSHLWQKSHSLTFAKVDRYDECKLQVSCSAAK